MLTMAPPPATASIKLDPENNSFRSEHATATPSLAEIAMAVLSKSKSPVNNNNENEQQQIKDEVERPNENDELEEPGKLVISTPVGGPSSETIETGAKFYSYTDFDTAFENWKLEFHHPFRVASSETLKMPDGSTNELFKYRYIVFHCAHYGAPRMRGAGKRPNQNYLPCGCRAMLRLNYSWTENALRVTTLNIEHSGHEVSAEAFYRFSAKLRRSSPIDGGASSSFTSSGSQPSPSPSPSAPRKRRRASNASQLVRPTVLKAEELTSKQFVVDDVQQTNSPLTPFGLSQSHHKENIPAFAQPPVPFGQNVTNNNITSSLPAAVSSPSTSNSPFLSLLSRASPSLLAGLQASALLANPQLMAAALSAFSPVASPPAVPPQTNPLDLSQPQPSMPQNQTTNNNNIGSLPTITGDQQQIANVLGKMRDHLLGAVDCQLKLNQLKLLMKSWEQTNGKY